MLATEWTNFFSLRAYSYISSPNVRLDWLWGPKQLLSIECGELSQRVKRPGCKAHQLPLASAVGKNVWNFTSIIPRRVMWSQRLYFTFILTRTLTFPRTGKVICLAKKDLTKRSTGLKWCNKCETGRQTELGER